MKRWRVVGQCAALAGAIVLAGGYVYVQAGGKLWPWQSQPAEDHGQEAIMSSSKLGVLRLPPGSLTDEAPKETAVTPPSEAPAEATAESSRIMIMAGSKSAAIFVPDASSLTPPQAAAVQKAIRQKPAVQAASPQP